jgi:hypothetical protein
MTTSVSILSIMADSWGDLWDGRIVSFMGRSWATSKTGR